METALKVDPSVPIQHFALSRNFFIAWQHRNASRQALWGKAPSDPRTVLAPPSQFDALRSKIHHLKSEIVSLIAQDMELFEQLFALQEEILELREQLECCPSSDESSSPYDSPCSTLSSLSSSENGRKCPKHSRSFVRHQVSYPPIRLNRSQRIKASSPQHGYQDSYDSGIHTSDHEIFV
ncbi:uncharacterized protein LOC110839503 [Zootermopsis nevadensis]|uniref:Uncharacterized protein n=1 Tax=Zootermopsis nevadensis TaxID=136037 RepID=A0A067QVH8_ZOONE|nr:uncharacterized protein LOC110839503 [Zootermopsis nevadensis]XP_021939442.1 uncharacterized protein LOC110839503 [Zootermopsis nevadensis]XP_021939443.1 uncharacterized protein LOC110839503 [Zootermopsis nevadensis]KDR08457.1 hypothetical protein L798_01213 [Zootermopsis nevadensis]